MFAGAHEGGFARLSQRGKWREGSVLSKGRKNKLTRVKGGALSGTRIPLERPQHPQCTRWGTAERC